MDSIQTAQPKPYFVHDIKPPDAVQPSPALAPKPQTPTQPTMEANLTPQLVDNLAVKDPTAQTVSMSTAPQPATHFSTPPQPFMDKILSEVNSAVHAEHDQHNSQSSNNQPHTTKPSKPMALTFIVLAAGLFMIAAVWLLLGNSQ